jgi:hypothetical protein
MLAIEPAGAQSITKPSIPEFAVKYVDRSYDIPPTYEVDEHTENTIETEVGKHVDNRTIEVTIKNQPFTSFTDETGRKINLFYNVRYKESFEQEWTSLFGERIEWADVYASIAEYGFPTQDSSSQYTTIIYSLPWNIVNGQMDIQVDALVGYTNRTVDLSRSILWSVSTYTFYGQESGWSPTQTVTLDNAPLFTPNPTYPAILSSPSIPINITSPPSPPSSAHGNLSQPTDSMPTATLLLAVIAVFAVVLVAPSVLLLKRQKPPT